MTNIPVKPGVSSLFPTQQKVEGTDKFLPFGSTQLAAKSATPSSDGNASGDTITVTASLLAGGFIQDGNAAGVVLTVTASLSPAGEFVFFAPGTTVTATASIAESGEAGQAHGLDGTAILEFRSVDTTGSLYIVEDYDSIFSIGDRIANGLITADSYGWSILLFSTFSSSFNGNYAFPGGDGLSYGNGTQSFGPSFWWTTPQNVDLRGLRFIGRENIGDGGLDFTLRGGVAPGDYESTAYTLEYDSNRAAQTSGPDSLGNYSYEWVFTKRNVLTWPHYELIWAHTQTAVSQRLCNEIELKVAHSNLDGGDRRSSNGDSTKRVTFTMDPSWTYRNDNSNGFYDPADACFDGLNLLVAAFNRNLTRFSQIGYGSGGSNPVSTVGAYLQFVFPRVVTMQHLLFQMNGTPEVLDSGGNPTRFGLWHWEISTNGGTSWAQVGSSWHFGEDAQYMLAPSPDGFGLDPSTAAATHWRMVLESGPAFGNVASINQIMFNLVDSGQQQTYFGVAFTDGTDDALSATISVTTGDPFTVAFTDGTDDALTFTLSIVVNPLISIAFDDGTDQLVAFGDFYPLPFVQSSTIVTGR